MNCQALLQHDCCSATLYRSGTYPRSRPFDVQTFFKSQLDRIEAMGAENEKERVSAEVVRSDPSTPVAPVLPTVNPAVEKSEPPAAKLHPSIYVM